MLSVALFGLLVSCTAAQHDYYDYSSTTRAPETNNPACGSGAPLELGGMSGRFTSPKIHDNTNNDYTTSRWTDLCAVDQPCQNGGTCIQSVNSAVYCSCLPGFHGYYCSMRDPYYDESTTTTTYRTPEGTCLSSLDCSHHGTCDGGMCVCYSEYAGLRCQYWTGDEPTITATTTTTTTTTTTYSDACRYYSDCNRNGQCYDGFCYCRSPYTGRNCETNLEGGSNTTTEMPTTIPPYDHCFSDHDCSGRGMCYGSWCACDVYYTGPRCEYDISTSYDVYPYDSSTSTGPPTCSSSYDCYNHGSCHDGQCLCYSSYTGSRCEYQIDEVTTTTTHDTPAANTTICRSHSDCLNHGACYRGVCQCYSNYTGGRCETVIGGMDCDRHTDCSDNGYCNYGRCICYSNYTGNHCETPPVAPTCDSNLCLNGGSCTVRNSGFLVCTCRSNYYGERCQYRRTRTHDDHRDTATDGCSFRCYNGGSCIRTRNGRMQCQCQAGYVGRRCQTHGSETTSYASPTTTTLGYSPCDSGPCMNNGACYEIYGDQYYCECGPRYTGNACEIYIGDNGSGSGSGEYPTSDGYSPCESYPCMNNGACYQTYGDQYYCECGPRYTGNACEIYIGADGSGYFPTSDGYSPCESYPCMNNGECYQTYGDQYYCECGPMYTGNTCEIYIGVDGSGYDPSATQDDYPLTCADMHCDNGGSCRTVSGCGYCDCIPEFRGRFCEEYVGDESVCTGDHCVNGGVCYSQYNTAYCDCPYDFSGTRCQYYVGNNHYYTTAAPYQHGACDAQPCQNDGHCNTYDGQIYCDCPWQYTGQWCEIYIPPSTDHDMIPTIHPNTGCSDRGSYLYGQSRCLCNPGFAGRNCEISTNSYTDSPYGDYLPDYYPNDVSCSWRITVPTNYMVYLEFTSFYLEHATNCHFDNVTVYDDSETYYRPVIGGPYCGIPEQRIRLDTGSDSVLVVMKTDFNVNEGGFEATYQAIPQVIVEPPNPEDRIRCYSCVYSESHGSTFGDPVCINPRTGNATELRCNGVCKDVHIVGPNRTYISRQCSTSCSRDESAVAVSFGRTITTTNDNQTTINNCCDGDRCNDRPLFNSTQTNSTQGNGKDPNAVGQNDERLCYVCTYSRSGNVENGRTCADPVVHHEANKTMCKGRCFIRRTSTSEEDYEAIERGCEDNEPANVCYDGNYYRDGHVYDEACCSQSLCNNDVLYEGLITTGAGAKITSAVTILLVSIAASLF